MFLHEVIAAERPKINLNSILRIKVFFEVFEPKVAQNGSKRKFFKFYEKSMH